MIIFGRVFEGIVFKNRYLWLLDIVVFLVFFEIGVILGKFWSFIRVRRLFFLGLFGY